MKPKPSRLSANWLTHRRKIAVFKGERHWLAMDGRINWNTHNDQAFETHAQAVEYAFRLAQTTEASA